MRKILIVDDDEDQVFGIKTYIEELYADIYEIITATSGEECIQLLEEKNVYPDLIILDIMMPGMDGYEVYSTIRLNRSWNRIPIIFLTAVDDVMQIKLGEEMGNDFIQKPIKMEDLVEKIEDQFESSD